MSVENINLDDEKVRAHYFHDMAGDSRSLELLLNICYNLNMVPVNASVGNKKNGLAYIVLNVQKKFLSIVGAFMDLVSEIEDSELNIISDKDGLRVKLSCNGVDGENLFMRMKEIIEENSLNNKQTFNYTVMSSVYNIAKIMREVIDADLLFGVDGELYQQGKCGLSIFKDKQISKINAKKPDKINDVIAKVKKDLVLNLPTVLFCSFEELRNFYFELDETVYSSDVGDVENGY